jgi:hypothetical protein
MLRSLARVGGAIRWREGWEGDVGGEVKAKVGVRWDSRVAIKTVGVVAVICFPPSWWLVVDDESDVDNDRW